MYDMYYITCIIVEARLRLAITEKSQVASATNTLVLLLFWE